MLGAIIPQAVHQYVILIEDTEIYIVLDKFLAILPVQIARDSSISAMCWKNVFTFHQLTASNRLKLSFIDISPPEGSNEPVNRSKVPVLASTFTEIFQVYSAKKFPGVIESTELSKCFAAQGIKIPIRKDGNNKNQINAEEYEADEQ